MLAHSHSHGAQDGIDPGATAEIEPILRPRHVLSGVEE